MGLWSVAVLNINNIRDLDNDKQLQNAYNKILKSFPSEYKEFVDELYPDYFLTQGMTGSDVKRFQKFLLSICKFDKSIPGVRVNGIFDDLRLSSTSIHSSTVLYPHLH